MVDFPLETMEKLVIEDSARVGLQLLDAPEVKVYCARDSRYGRIYKKGSIKVGIVIHSDCVVSGHGSGVTTLFTSTKGMIKLVISWEANMAKLLGLRDDI